MSENPMAPQPPQQFMQLPAQVEQPPQQEAPQPQTPAEPPQQRQRSLQEYASGYAQLARELTRQNDAYGHFRNVVTRIDELIKNPGQAPNGLPFVTFTFPVTDGTVPGELKLDLNTMPTSVLAAIRPLFDQLQQTCGADFIAAMKGFYQLDAETRPVVEAMEAATSGG